jgi:23S rRNA pseudouridine1911/1915/1917 synthase
VTSSGGEPRRILADRGDAGERLDRVLLRHLADLPELSRTKIQELIEGGSVAVAGRAVTKTSAKVKAADELVVTLPPPPPPRREHEGQDIPLTVLYEDEHLLAIDKPAGLVVHPAVGHRDGTLVNALLHRSKDWAGDADRPGLVHRLDKDTSGVLVVAKTEAAMTALSRAIQARKLDKQYLAVVYGVAPLQKGKIELGIHRHPTDRKRMTTSKTAGRASTTIYERVAESQGERAGVSLLRCHLVTGRTHQIRVHLKALGLPLVGDPVYGAPRWKGIRDEALRAACRDFPRQALHAHRLALTHPITGVRIELVAPPPDDLRRLCGAAGLPAAF